MQRVVLIDDDLEDLELIEEAIKIVNPSAECIPFFDACEALEYLMSHDLPDVVIIDLNMPNISGVECMEQLRNHPKFATLVLVVNSSALPANEIMETIVALGGVFLQKPSTLHELNDVIHGIMNRP